jgi:hypothetical protein
MSSCLFMFEFAKCYLERCLSLSLLSSVSISFELFSASKMRLRLTLVPFFLSLSSLIQASPNRTDRTGLRRSLDDGTDFSLSKHRRHHHDNPLAKRLSESSSSSQCTCSDKVPLAAGYFAGWSSDTFPPSAIDFTRYDLIIYGLSRS